MTKNSFLMYTDWGDMIEELDEENRSQLLLAIMRYQSDKELPEMDLGARVAFAQIRTQFRKDEEKYSKTIANRSAAGKLGGRPKKASNSEKQKKQMLFDESKSKQTKTKKADNDNEYDNDLKENTIDGVKEKRFAPPTLENVSGYCREMGYTNVDAARFIDFYTSNGWMVGKNRMKDWKAAVRNWDRREKNPQRQDGAAEVAKKNRFHNLEEHGYDYDAMVWGMVGAAAQGEAGSTVKPGTG